MWLPRVVAVPPAREPVTLEEAKADLRVDGSDDDAWIERRIAAARAHVEQLTGLALVTQTLELTASCWSDVRRLPVAPVASVAAVRWLDAAGAEQTLDPASWRLSAPGGLVAAIVATANVSWPTTAAARDAVRVRLVAGYGDDEAVPSDLKAAISLLVGHWYLNREAVLVGSISKAVEFGVDALTGPYRLFV